MFSLSILTPEKRLVTDQEIEEVIVPGGCGQMDVMPGHAPLVSTLSAGIVRYRRKDETEYQPLAVSWGYMEVHAEGVVVLVETAELPSEVDRNRAEEALKKAQHFLEDMTIEPTETAKYQRKVERALVRLALINSENLTH